MKHKIEELLDVMARLRDPDGGCPWDQKQTFETIVPFTLEEAYEVAEAIENNDISSLRDELGDLLFQVVFYSQIAKEENRFEFNDVVDGIVEKMIRRHPHVFADVDVEDEHAVKANWEKIKAEERKQKNNDRPLSILDGVNQALPGLSRAKKLQKRASDVGFDWPDPSGVLSKIDEEFVEVQEAMASGDMAHVEEEIGDLFFVIVNLARHLKIDPETAIRKANRKFESRFHCMEAIAVEREQEMRNMSLDDMDLLWNQAKDKLKTSS